MKAKTRNWVIALCVLAALIIVIAVPSARRARAEEAEDSVQAIRESVMQRALQCYVIEGAYPVSLEYLEENSVMKKMAAALKELKAAIPGI